MNRGFLWREEKHNRVTSDSWNSFGAIAYLYELKKRGDSNNNKDGNDRRWTHNSLSDRVWDTEREREREREREKERERVKERKNEKRNEACDRKSEIQIKK